MPEGNIRQDIGHILAFIGGNLERFINIFQLDHGHAIVRPEEARDRLCEDIICKVLEPVYLDAAFPDIIGILIERMPLTAPSISTAERCITFASSIIKTSGDSMP